MATVVAASVLLAACGVRAHGDGPDVRGGGTAVDNADVIGADIGPTTSVPESTTTLPPAEVDIEGSTGSPLDILTGNVIDDLDEFWGREYPPVYDEAYKPLTGGFFAVGPDSDLAGLPCNPTDLSYVIGNAYYCPQADAIVWDRVRLLPDLAERYGEFTVGIVLAHEWGHAIQARALENGSTVTLELQADCMAGAWTRHVSDGGSQRLSVSTEELDRALAGILSLKDAPGSLATDPNAHGSGFDRVSAFQDGFEQGVSRCARYQDGDPRPFQFPFGVNDGSGNLPYDDDGVNTPIIMAATSSLEIYWAEVFPDLSAGRAWDPLAPAEPFKLADPPDCDGEKVKGFALYYCVPDRYVGYDDEETMPEAYRLGDFAVATLFATQYGLAVQDALDLDAPDELTAVLRGDCMAGAWAGALIPTDDPDPDYPYELLLSPGDLDEAVAVLLSYRPTGERAREGPGFDRVRVFRVGVLEGPEACLKVSPRG